MKKGFTLIELLVVILIIGILVTVALPQYQLAIDKARYMRVVSDLEAVKQAEENYYLAHRNYTPNWDELDISLPGYELDITQGANGENVVLNRNKKYGSQYLSIKNAITRSEDNTGCSGGNSAGCTAGNIQANSQSGALYYVYLDQAWKGEWTNPQRPTRQEKRQCIARDNNQRTHRLCKALGGKLIHDTIIAHDGRSYSLPW